MSVRVMAWVWSHSRSKPTQRLVLLAIADCANDQGREAYPAIATIATKTGLTDRSVRRAVVELAELGELGVQYKTGPGGCNRYRIIMADPEPPSGSANTRTESPGTRTQSPGVPAPDPDSLSGNPDSVTGDPDTLSGTPGLSVPRTILNHQGTIRNQKRGARARTKGTRLPPDFAPSPDAIDWARQRVPNVNIELETEKFANYWAAAAGANSIKLDWSAAWRNWMLKATEYGGHPTNGRRTSTTDQRMAAAQALKGRRSATDEHAEDALIRGRRLQAQREHRQRLEITNGT